VYAAFVGPLPLKGQAVALPLDSKQLKLPKSPVNISRATPQKLFALLSCSIHRAMVVCRNYVV